MSLFPENKPWWHKWYHRKPWAGPHGLRMVVLARDPVCKICQRAASTVADHIKPHKGVWALFVDLKNLQGICKACHDKKTASEDGGFGNTAVDANAPVTTGKPGKQFTTTAVGEDAIDAALGDTVKLLEGL